MVTDGIDFGGFIPDHEASKKSRPIIDNLVGYAAINPLLLEIYFSGSMPEKPISTPAERHAFKNDIANILGTPLGAFDDNKPQLIDRFIEALHSLPVANIEYRGQGRDFFGDARVVAHDVLRGIYDKMKGNERFHD